MDLSASWLSHASPRAFSGGAQHLTFGRELRELLGAHDAANRPAWLKSELPLLELLEAVILIGQTARASVEDLGTWNRVAAADTWLRVTLPLPAELTNTIFAFVFEPASAEAAGLYDHCDGFAVCSIGEREQLIFNVAAAAANSASSAYIDTYGDTRLEGLPGRDQLANVIRARRVAWALAYRDDRTDAEAYESVGVSVAAGDRIKRRLGLSKKRR